MNEDFTGYVVYTMDEKSHPDHFLAVAETQDEAREKMDTWWHAFMSGEKDEPPEYGGISFRPVASFADWPAGPTGETDE